MTQTNSWKGFLPKTSTVMAKHAPKIEKSAPQCSKSMVEIREAVLGCTSCRLSQERTHAVPGEGNENARLVFVGEGPGYYEDQQGRPFVGKSGQLLDRMIQAMGLSRSEVFICNVVKCRPPDNRNPEPDEISACSGYLHQQLDLIKPEVIVALGKFAAQTLLNTDQRISLLRGKFHEYRGIDLMPTYHPSFLLRNPDSKREAWEDLKKVASKLQIDLPARQ